MTRRSKATSTSLRLVGGKGGVGKTTCAAAFGVRAAASRRRVLVISTDPAPSLGDALGVRLGSTPRAVPGCPGLSALEIDSRAALEAWLAPRTPVLEEIAVRGTWLDRSDVQRLLRLSFPGIDEIAGLLEILRYVRSGAYDEVVIDTAPTGHTLRMLELPETLAGLARAFDHMQEKHRIVVEALRGFRREDAADALIRALDEDADALRRLLRDPERTEVVLVALPERLATEETLDAARALEASGIAVTRVIVNRLLTAPPEPCDWCDERRHLEVEQVGLLTSALHRAIGRPTPVSAIVSREPEPVGLAALRAIGRELAGAKPVPAPARRRRPGRRVTMFPRGWSDGPAPALDRATLIMFGGKGGVGKTTCAAAAALRMAAEQGSARLLLVSTDPAHSLADVLRESVSDVAAQARDGPPNLEVRELAAADAMDRVRREYAAAVDAAFDRLTGGSGLDAAHDRRVLHDLLGLAPPGLDEIAAILELTDLLDARHRPRRYDCLVLDTAPSGHALRLLEMPATVHDWVKALMAILLKYQPVTGLGDLGAALLRLSQGLGRLRALLQDPAAACFVVVTRASALPRAESTRLMRRLTRLRISVPAVIVNATGGGDCRRCRSAARRERTEVTTLASFVAKHARASTLIVTPAAVPPPAGAKELAAWRASWRSVPRAPHGTRRREARVR